MTTSQQKTEESLDYPIIPETHSSIYLMHKYWARKPANIVAHYIKKYSNPSEIVLDPFMGSGVTILESILNNRKAIGVDINPVAKFICENTGSNVDLSLFTEAFQWIKQQILASNSLYRKLQIVQCPKCKKEAKITHIIWNNGDENQNNACIEEIRLTCEFCHKTIYNHEKIPTIFADLVLLIENSENLALEWLSELNIQPPLFNFQYSQKKNFIQLRHHLRQNNSMHHLFTNRNLAILTYIHYFILNMPQKYRFLIHSFLFCFTSAIGQASKMVWVIDKRNGKKLKTRQVGSWTHHFFWDPSHYFEINAWSCFVQRINKFIRGKKELKKHFASNQYPFIHANRYSDLSERSPVLLLNQSCTQLKLPNNSVDFIFTDPPYGDSIQYGELSSLWASWLQLNMETYLSQIENHEIIMNSHQKKNLLEYRNQLFHSFCQLSRILKPNKYMVLTFHNTSLEIRNVLIEEALKAGFELKQILFQLPPRVSIKSMLHHKGSPIGDYYIRFKNKIQNKIHESAQSTIYSPYSQWDSKFLDPSSHEPDHERIYDKICAIIRKILQTRGEPTREIWISNLIDEELFKAKLFPLPNIQEYLHEILDSHEFIRDSEQNWWFTFQSEHIRLEKPLTTRIEHYLHEIIPTFNFHRFSSTKKQTLFNLVYSKYRGILTPDKFQINTIIDQCLKMKS